MVVLAASICTKAGKPVISRQFHAITRTRIESLLSSFPKLLPPTGSSQHTLLETNEVRYVYQPLEDLYILLVTNKASNILQDIDTLHLFARLVSDHGTDERAILNKAFEILNAFDQVVNLGYRDNVNLSQVRTILEMESHEEKIQEIIARNKEAEAKEELKRRAKQLEMQRREAQRRGVSAASLGYQGGAVSGAYTAVPTSPTPSAVQPARTTTAKPTFKSGGLKLGGAKKVRQAELIDELGAAPPSPASAAAAAKPAPVTTTGTRGSIAPVPESSVHISLSESISLSISRDTTSLVPNSLILHGELSLKVSNGAFSNISVELPDAVLDDLQFKTHPKINKLDAPPHILSLKSSGGYPLSTPLTLLKYRLPPSSTSAESLLPLSLTSWPSPSSAGQIEVSLEYELEGRAKELGITLSDLVISVPLPDGSYPTVTGGNESWSVNPASHSLDWAVPSASESGSLVFTIPGEDPDVFFPVRVSFVASGSLALGIASGSSEGLKVTNLASGEELAGGEVSVDALIGVDEYQVV